MNRIIWLTGNSESGKTTLANKLKNTLQNYIILDGDEMRSSISLNAGFSKEAREEHNLKVARLAKIIQKQGYNVLISVIAPFQSTRDKIDKIIECDWVCIRGRGKFGENYPYEEPKNALMLRGLNVEEEVKAVIEAFKL